MSLFVAPSNYFFSSWPPFVSLRNSSSPSSSFFLFFFLFLSPSSLLYLLSTFSLSLALPFFGFLPLMAPPSSLLSLHFFCSFLSITLQPSLFSFLSFSPLYLTLPLWLSSSPSFSLFPFLSWFSPFPFWLLLTFSHFFSPSFSFSPSCCFFFCLPRIWLLTKGSSSPKKKIHFHVLMLKTWEHGCVGDPMSPTF